MTTVVRCSGISDDGRCGRQQAIAGHGPGFRVARWVSPETATWLSSFGWRRASDDHWLCPFCGRSEVAS